MRIIPILPLVVLMPITVIIVILFVICLIKKDLRKAKNIRRLSMLALMTIILVRPVFLGGQTNKVTTNLNIFFVVDATPSMGTKDVDGDARFMKVANDVYKIATSFKGSRYSVIVEDNSVYSALPVSDNLDYLVNIQGTDLRGSTNQKSEIKRSIFAPKNIYYSSGTNLSELLSFASNRISKYYKDNPSRNNIVFFMSDGDDSPDSVLRELSSFRSSIAYGAVFGYGSKEGDIVPTPTKDYSEETECIAYSGSNTDIEIRPKSYPKSDGDGEKIVKCAVSKLNEETLQKIASILGVAYYHRDENDIPNEVLKFIREQIKYDRNDDTESYRDTYWLFSLVLLGLLMWDFREILNGVMRERGLKHA